MNYKRLLRWSTNPISLGITVEAEGYFMVDPIEEEIRSHAAFLLDRAIECLCGQRIEAMNLGDLHRVTSLIKQVTDRTRDDYEEIDDLNLVFHVIQLTETVVGIASHEMTEQEMEVATSEVRLAVAAKLAELESHIASSAQRQTDTVKGIDGERSVDLDSIATH